MSVDFTNLDLDLTLLHEIADGSDEFIAESINMFLEQTPISLQEVSNAIEAHDWLTAASAAHKLKATLGFFGMLNSQSLIQQIELNCKSSSPDEFDIISKNNQVQMLIAASTNALIQLKNDIER
jgi:HPt (histidine-containing phosphotransfer) domain-containing protein